MSQRKSSTVDADVGPHSECVTAPFARDFAPIELIIVSLSQSDCLEDRFTICWLRTNWGDLIRIVDLFCLYLPTKLQSYVNWDVIAFDVHCLAVSFVTKMIYKRFKVLGITKLFFEKIFFLIILCGNFHINWTPTFLLYHLRKTQRNAS